MLQPKSCSEVFWIPRRVSNTNSSLNHIVEYPCVHSPGLGVEQSIMKSVWNQFSACLKRKIIIFRKICRNKFLLSTRYLPSSNTCTAANIKTCNLQLDALRICIPLDVYWDRTLQCNRMLLLKVKLILDFRQQMVASSPYVTSIE